MARSTNMLPAWTSTGLRKGKNKKHVIPPCQRLLRQNKAQNGPNVQWALPALRFILLFISAFPEHGLHASQLSLQMKDMIRSTSPGFVGRRRSAKSPPESGTDLKDECAEVWVGRKP